MSEYEHLVYDISYAALRVVGQAVRSVAGGTLDLTVQVELENFANECDSRIQHHEKEVRRAQIAELNAQHRGTPPPIIHINVPPSEDYGDLV